MAAQLKLVLRNDILFSSDIETIDLLPWLVYRGWRQAIAVLDNPVDEAITLNISAASTDDLAASFQSIDRIIKRASWYAGESIEPLGLWLRAQLTGESNARQALIIDAKRQSAQLLDEWGDEHISIDDVLGLKRYSWEDLTSTLSFQDTLPTTGSKSLGLPIRGDIPARMSVFSLTGSFGGGGPLTRCWAGFISDRWVTPVNFVPVWEAETGTPYSANNAAVTTANDSTASPLGGGTNKSVRVTMSNPALVLRWTMTVLQASAAHPADQRGRFLVLGRFKCTDGTTQCRVQLQSGFVNNTGWKSSARQLVSGTSWNIYELGQVQIPQVGRFIDSAQVNQAALRIFAERISGSGDLDFDCLTLIPIGEGSIYFHGGQVEYVGSTGQFVSVYGMADGRVLAGGTKDGVSGFAFNDIIAEVKFGVPTGTVYFVMAAARETSSVLADYVTFDLRTTSRWMTLRGSGTST